MNYLTMDELAEFLNINIGTIRIFLEHFTLSKHLLRQKILIGATKRKHRIKVTFKINGQSLYDLEKYLNMKGKLGCKQKANALGYKYSWGYIQGCVLEKPDGNKILLEKLRYNELN